MPLTLPGRARLRRLVARGVVGLAVLVTGLVLLSLLGAAWDDAAIDARTGRATAEVISVSPSRALVRFTAADGELHTPERGVGYPSGLVPGQLVRVEYAIRDPDRVRVAGRSWMVGLTPALVVIAATWLLALALARVSAVPRRRVRGVATSCPRCGDGVADAAPPAATVQQDPARSSRRHAAAGASAR